MKLISGAAIKETLVKVSPVRIAVAYVGADWRQYVNDQSLKEIILSPTLGSNPRAIGEIVALLRWDNVHFLDNLHAKIYIGEKMATVGSFNLSANGLSAEGLEEAGFVVDDTEILNQLQTLFVDLKLQAVAQYPSEVDKRKQLSELRTLWNKATSEKLIRNDSRKRLLRDYEPLSDDEFYVCWHRGDVALDKEVIAASVPAASGARYEEVIGNCMAVLETDDIKKYGWILCWKLNADGTPSGREKPYWIAIDEVVSGGVVEGPYTKLAIEREDKDRPEYPFELGSKEIAAIRAVLSSNRFPEFLASFSEKWSVTPTIPRLRDFIEALKDELRLSANEVKQIPPSQLLTPNVLSNNRLRSVLNPVLLFASDALPGLELTDVGKIASWAVHFILAESGYPQDYAGNRAGEAAGTATAEWVFGRLHQLKNGKQNVLKILSAFADETQFGDVLQYWAREARTKFRSMMIV